MPSAFGLAGVQWSSIFAEILYMLRRYWVVFASMAFSALAFATITFMKPMHARAHGCESLSLVTGLASFG